LHDQEKEEQLPKNGRRGHVHNLIRRVSDSAVLLRNHVLLLCNSCNQISVPSESVRNDPIFSQCKYVEREMLYEITIIMVVFAITMIVVLTTGSLQ